MTYEEFKQEVFVVAEEMKLTDYELYATEATEVGITIVKQELKSYNCIDDRGVCFRCVIDGKSGNAATQALTKEDARSIVLNAIDNTKALEVEEKSFIHGKGDAYATVSEKEFYEPSGNELITMGFEMQKANYAADSRVSDGTQTFVGTETVRYMLSNSKGLDLKDTASCCYVGSQIILADRDEKYTHFEGKISDFETVTKLANEIANTAVTKTVETVGAKSVPTGKYKCLLDNEALYTLLSAFSSIFYGEAVQKDLSMLKGKVGEQIAAEIITLIDDPLYKDAPTKRTFDDEGVATFAKEVISEGTLKTFLYNLKSANVDGVQSTGNGFKAGYTAPITTFPGSFYIKPGTYTKEALMEEIGDGIMVCQLTGLHAGAHVLSGDFSLLSSGFRIRDGKKAEPIRNFTISGNFYELLKNIKKLGDDLAFPKLNSSSCRYGAPSALLDEIMVAGE